MRLRPDENVTPEDLARGRHALVRDAAWATTAGALYGGVILVGFALELGASPLIIGLLAAIPFLAQLSQAATIALIERVRQRRTIAFTAVTTARTLILGLAVIPFVEGRPLQLTLLVAGQAAISLAGSVGGCAFNGWVHQIVPREQLGRLFSRRLFWSTVLSTVGALAAGYLVQTWPSEQRLHAYAVAFVAAGAAGYVSSYYLLQVPEPPMPHSGRPMPLVEILRAPVADPNFRQVVLFMASWNLASNIAAPFITVYLLRQIGLELGTLTLVWAAGQTATALTMALWGRLSDTLSNKAILSVALPLYFTSLMSLPFAALPASYPVTLGLIFVIQVVMGAASGGIGLATGNLGLKLAPQGRGSGYLAVVSLAGSAAAGLAALGGGVLADWFAARELSLSVQWMAPGTMREVTVLHFQHWGFLFAISFALGFYVLHRLSRVQEGQEHSERAVIQQFVIEAFRSIDQLSPIEGLRTVVLLPFPWLRERKGRPPPEA